LVKKVTRGEGKIDENPKGVEKRKREAKKKTQK